ncbi:6-bladed beta-propeller [Bacteroides sp. BFG-257]|uniref:6-bladed beta-propeller n=1 Tax=Bacteroides sp. BFG-257 TaxID=2972761 RepID=UPI002163BC1E|nr:6-bladed beta-propeller [Bacteroides sp. BFG-257]UVO99476.1 6-bladed beta-propeller [Bacteroides sp. BFG-257]
MIDPQKGQRLPFDSLIEKIEYVKLESLNDNLIGKIYQILFSDSLLFIIDSESTKTINIFDLQGNFKYRICHVGNGPKEYVDISNVCIVPDKKQLAILDRIQRRILYYKYNGEYVLTEQTPFINDYFEYLESGNKAYEIYGMNDPKLGGDKENSLVVTNSVNDVIYSFLKIYIKRIFIIQKIEPCASFKKKFIIVLIL